MNSQAEHLHEWKLENTRPEPADDSLDFITVLICAACTPVCLAIATGLAVLIAAVTIVLV